MSGKEPPEVDQSGNDKTESPEVTEIETGIDDSEGFPSADLVKQKILALKARREAAIDLIDEDEKKKKKVARGAAKVLRIAAQAALDKQIEGIHATSVGQRAEIRQAFTPPLSQLNALKKTAESLELLQPTED